MTFFVQSIWEVATRQRAGNGYAKEIKYKGTNKGKAFENRCKVTHNQVALLMSNIDEITTDLPEELADHEYVLAIFEDVEKFKDNLLAHRWKEELDAIGRNRDTLIPTLAKYVQTLKRRIDTLRKDHQKKLELAKRVAEQVAANEAKREAKKLEEAKVKALDELAKLEHMCQMYEGQDEESKSQALHQTIQVTWKAIQEAVATKVLVRKEFTEAYVLVLWTLGLKLRFEDGEEKDDDDFLGRDIFLDNKHYGDLSGDDFDPLGGDLNGGDGPNDGGAIENDDAPNGGGAPEDDDDPNGGGAPNDGDAHNGGDAPPAVTPVLLDASDDDDVPLATVANLQRANKEQAEKEARDKRRADKNVSTPVDLSEKLKLSAEQSQDFNLRVRMETKDNRVWINDDQAKTYHKLVDLVVMDPPWGVLMEDCKTNNSKNKRGSDKVCVIVIVFTYGVICTCL